MISRAQYNLLKRAIKSKELCVDDLNDIELEQAKFLYKNKFLVVSERKTSSSNGITGIYIYKYKVSQSGEAEMYLFKTSFYKWWVPVVISIGAFIVSIIALFR